MCHSLRSVLKNAAILALVLGVGLATVLAAPAANTCNGSSELNYPTAPNFSSVGDTVHVVLTLGAGGIQGGTSLSISRVRFNLDCDSSNLGINCPDDGGVVSYQGNLSTTCGSAFTASHNAGDVLPNQVVFTPSSAIVVPANTPAFCTLEFDVRIETTSNDATPTVIEQVSGFDASLGDGVCNTAPPLAAGNTNSGSLTLCPVCDDGNQCNGVETCDPQLGCQPGTPITCNDNNVCTSDSCDPNVPACRNLGVGGPVCGDPCVYTPGAQGSCDDNNVCTTDACDPVVGCTHTPGAQGSCDDNNVCTTDACDPIQGCTHTPGAQGSCDDNNVCTTDACDPIQGCTHTPGAQGSCDDNNVCTTDACDPIAGCTHTPGAQGSCDDNNVCTTDACDPIAGCTHTPGAQGSCDDNNTCTTDACDPIQGCTHTPGAQGSCDDNDVCTTDNCDPVAGCTHTPGAQGSCDDNNVCTTDACDPIAGCTHTPGAQGSCDDNNVCTTDACDPVSGCTHTPGAQGSCDDSNVCTTDACDPIQGCTHTPGAQGSCDDNDVCTTDACDPVAGCTHTPGAKGSCDDNNACTTDSCDPIDGCVHSPGALDCDDHDKCTTDSCDPEEGCVNAPITCNDNDTCTDDTCDPETGCVYTPNGSPECSLPCRITGGGIVYEDTGDVITDPNLLAEIQRATFGGQVGAPFGIVGCHDDFDQIQGEWTHIRHKHRGSFHAADYNSLVCGCDDGNGGPGVLDGNLCNPGNRETGPEPRRAPANIACWTGVGNYNPTNGRRTLRVAFRVEVEDRGEPGAGQNAGNLEDVYRIRIWIPTHSEDENVLANQACCTNAVPDIRLPDVSDGGNLIHGNLQIHPPTGNPNNP